MTPPNFLGRRRGRAQRALAARRLSFETLESRTLMTATPTISELSRDRSSPGFNFVFQGNATPNNYVSVIQAGGVVGTTVADASGHWTIAYSGAELRQDEFRFHAVAGDGLHVSRPSADSIYKPNFVLINTDDMAAHDLMYMPLTNQLLANSGTTFNNSFVPTSLSGPSRASLLTGLYAENTGVFENISPLGGEVNLDRNATLPVWLQGAGYRTAGFGKWETVSESMGSLGRNQSPPGWNDFSYTGHHGFEFFHDGQRSVVPYNNDTTGVWAGMSESFIRQSSSSDQPFFLYYAPTITHQPYEPLPQDLGSMAGVSKWRPPSYNVVPDDVTHRPGLDHEAGWDLKRERFLESLQAVDRAVANIYHTLAATGELDNTVFVFTADNGLMWGEHGLSSTKDNFYDESLRVPLVIRDGRAPLSQTAQQMALNVDIAPTFVRLAGASAGHSFDGMNLTPVLHGSDQPLHQSFVMEHHWIQGWTYLQQGYGRGGVGIRTETWKYVQYDSGKVDLFNLVKDPFEMNNLGDDPAYEAIRQTLAQKLQASLPSDHTGPEVTRLSGHLEDNDQGEPFLQISGEVSETLSGGSTLRTPEYYIDRLGSPGWGKGLDTADGSFDSTTEAFIGRVPHNVLAQLAPGTHTLYVRGRDVHGNWGDAVAVSFDIPGGPQTPPPPVDLPPADNEGGDDVPSSEDNGADDPSTPPITNPPVSKPPVTTPPVTTPPVTTPPVTIPSSSKPPIKTPPTTKPPVKTPPISMPPLTTPRFGSGYPVSGPVVVVPPPTSVPATPGIPTPVAGGTTGTVRHPIHAPHRGFHRPPSVPPLVAPRGGDISTHVPYVPLAFGSATVIGSTELLMQPGDVAMTTVPVAPRPQLGSQPIFIALAAATHAASDASQDPSDPAGGFWDPAWSAAADMSVDEFDGSLLSSLAWTSLDRDNKSLDDS
jgi:arylsulfatase A-like enzyme